MATLAFARTVAHRVAGGPQAALAPAQLVSRQPRNGWSRAAPLAPSPARAPRLARRGAVQVANFAILQRLGLKKPAWLPDFGQDKRRAILERFFSSPISREVRGAWRWQGGGAVERTPMAAPEWIC